MKVQFSSEQRGSGVRLDSRRFMTRSETHANRVNSCEVKKAGTVWKERLRYGSIPVQSNLRTESNVVRPLEQRGE